MGTGDTQHETNRTDLRVETPVTGCVAAISRSPRLRFPLDGDSSAEDRSRWLIDKLRSEGYLRVARPSSCTVALLRIPLRKR